MLLTGQRSTYIGYILGAFNASCSSMVMIERSTSAHNDHALSIAPPPAASAMACAAALALPEAEDCAMASASP
jgi:hypothetical protein